jgi:hypothetical protein
MTTWNGSATERSEAANRGVPLAAGIVSAEPHETGAVGPTTHRSDRAAARPGDLADERNIQQSTTAMQRIDNRCFIR